MKRAFARVGALFLLMPTVISTTCLAESKPATGANPSEQSAEATAALVREIQFMLLRLGLDPGPIDGIPRQLTNRALRRFEATHNLPLIDLEPGGKVPSDLLTALRNEAARAVFGAPEKPETPPTAAATPPPSPARPPAAVIVPPPPPDPFAACAYEPEDFRIGANSYTPESFLRDGFDGSTARAVANLKQRLEEARQIADRVGLSALKEVQRQARVLKYFECRLNVEQASAGNK
jgi:peptidoglycan hydrolase-like protein with peptidoglycan-binding domain